MESEQSNVLATDLQGESETLALGHVLATAFKEANLRIGIVFLQGDLGMGKTTLSPGVLRALGHEGKVKSPTYTLVEPYQLSSADIYHFDLYRLGDPEELEFMGIRDYFSPLEEGEHPVLCVVEWPDKAGGLIPSPSVTITLSAKGMGRRARLEFKSQEWESCFRNGLETNAILSK